MLLKLFPNCTLLTSRVLLNHFLLLISQGFIESCLLLLSLVTILYSSSLFYFILFYFLYISIWYQNSPTPELYYRRSSVQPSLSYTIKANWIRWMSNKTRKDWMLPKEYPNGWQNWGRVLGPCTNSHTDNQDSLGAHSPTYGGVSV